MKRTLVLLGVLFLAQSSFAQDEPIEMGQIVVTPYRYSEELSRTPQSVTVITQKDIANLNANTVLDVIRATPGLVVRDWIGNATKASVDIRGFGEQSGMNVLVMIDGRRVNETDLSGVDWKQVPLNQVKSIEIIRGGNSVLYGDNAVAGAINIITKSGYGSPKLELGSQYGSFDFNAQKISLSGSKKEFSYWITGSRDATHGYRNNSFYDGRDFAAKLGYDIASDFSLSFNSGYHRASFGFPGALSSADLINFGRKYSKFGDDRATDKDYFFVLGQEKGLGKLGTISMDTSFRRKEVNSNFIGANSGWNPLLKTRIDTYGFTPKYKLENPVVGFENKLLSGVDIYRYDYSADTFNAAGILQDFTDINKITVGGYLQDEFSILKDLILVGGYRYEGAKYEFDYHDNSGWNPDINKDIQPNEKAFNGGLIYNYKDDSSVFFNLNRSFRFPATDEYFTWGTLNTDLKPQESRNYELGVRHRFNPKFRADISLFLMKVKNELFYNPIGGPFGFGANENYDKTRRQGVEFAFDSKPFKSLGFFGNYSFNAAKFDGGLFDDNYVPMSPLHKGTLGIRLILPKNFTLNLMGNYVDKRYFINDQANRFSRLNSYATMDTNLTFEYKQLSISAGINNIFDKEYSEFAVCNSATGAKNYYPNPGRNFNIKFDYKF